MTAAELDKARDWRRKRGIRDDKMLSGTRIDELIVTYGAAQYEAGAASTKELLREVWAEFQALAAVDAPELSWPDMQKRVEAAVRALPLREKEG